MSHPSAASFVSLPLDIGVLLYFFFLSIPFSEERVLNLTGLHLLEVFEEIGYKWLLTLRQFKPSDLLWMAEVFLK